MSHSLDLPADQKRQLLATLLHRQARDEVRTAPLSYGQRALWFVYQLDRTSSAYNIVCAAHIRGDVKHDCLQRALQRLVDGHATLRTTYGMHEGVPAARVH